MAVARKYLIIGLISAAAVALPVFIALSQYNSLPFSPFSTPSPSASTKELRIALVTDAVFTDQGWGTAAYNAGKSLESKYGYQVTFADHVEIADIESTLQKYAASNYDLIIAHGYQWGDPAIRVAKQYPNVKFVVFTGLVKANNVASIFPMQQEGSFLLGALAGMMTKTNVIGYVGGDEYPNVINIFEGYKQGARMVNPDVKIVGTYLSDWNNPDKGKEAATSLIKTQKADFLLHVADTSGHGVIQAAENNGIYAFGAVGDQSNLAPYTVLTSFVVDIDKSYDGIVQSVVNGTFHGEIFKPGIEAGKGSPGDGIVFIAPFHELDDKVPQNAKVKLQELIQGLLDNKIQVPERESPTS